MIEMYLGRTAEEILYQHYIENKPFEAIAKHLQLAPAVIKRVHDGAIRFLQQTKGGASCFTNTKDESLPSTKP